MTKNAAHTVMRTDSGRMTKKGIAEVSAEEVMRAFISCGQK